MGSEASEDESRMFTVCPTADRDFSKEYIAQVNELTLREVFPGTDPGDFLLVRNTIDVPEASESDGGYDRESNDGPGDVPETMTTELHTPVFLSDDISHRSNDRDCVGDVGLDFTVRTALGAPSELELEHGEGAQSEAAVEVEPMENPETKLWKRLLNRGLGVRPQVCRVRVGVFPHLEDKVCRLPKNTIDIPGMEEGENASIESTRGDTRIVRGVEASEIDDERKATKQKQKETDENRYPHCEELLDIEQIRRTEVDIPEIWVDEEVRVQLGLQDPYKSGVCQPVRVYRDTLHLLGQMLHQFAIPLVVVVIAAGINTFESHRRFAVGLWIAAILVWIAVLGAESHSRLS